MELKKIDQHLSSIACKKIKLFKNYKFLL